MARMVIAGRSHGGAAAGQRGQPEHPAARADHVEPGVRQGQRRRGVGQVPDLRPGPGPLGERHRLAERLELGRDRRMARDVGAGEVRENPGDPDLAGGFSRDAPRRPGRASRPRSRRPAPSGVGLEVDPGRAADPLGRGRDPADQVGRAHGEVDVVTDGVLVRRVRRGQQAQDRGASPPPGAAPAPRPRGPRRARSRRRPGPRPPPGSCRGHSRRP